MGRRTASPYAEAARIREIARASLDTRKDTQPLARTLIARPNGGRGLAPTT